MRLVQVVALAVLVVACRADPPSADSVRELVVAADSVRVTVYRDGGEPYPPAVVSEPASIARLATLLEFEGRPSRRGPGALATTVAADLDLSGAEESRLLLRANRLFFGPNHAFEVELASDALYRHLRALVGAD